MKRGARLGMQWWEYAVLDLVEAMETLTAEVADVEEAAASEEAEVEAEAEADEYRVD